jgi:hypothetical protein
MFPHVVISNCSVGCETTSREYPPDDLDTTTLRRRRFALRNFPVFPDSVGGTRRSLIAFLTPSFMIFSSRSIGNWPGPQDVPVLGIRLLFPLLQRLLAVMTPPFITGRPLSVKQSAIFSASFASSATGPGTLSLISIFASHSRKQEPVDNDGNF